MYDFFYRIIVPLLVGLIITLVDHWLDDNQ
ncbi:type I toxin-antitoxin system Fst family toxin [Lacticaseibacillus paracasei]|nr:type I toxin-antitoxin system Fst family toxin [Lacticaseibacillus paracasei]AUC01860.1 holin-like toxin [Lacticaseibacillus paracasei subsp. paracasei]EKQ25378.1 putative holin-like toxin [Lacticaseibacillus paracasei]ERN49722.1 hypothetical protein N422_07585 [Lacticaseibacillus paracasei]MCT3317369.1 type I toxin-antitoxin system Fst family toxin [Lacticaseibacillus paracasei]MDH7443592.1 type I toxin-antitoxin system Fst family toxin [Lacticaseibacillus paracasei subsp. paracasei]